MDNSVDGALTAARASRYLSKAQAVALADEVGRLRSEVETLVRHQEQTIAQRTHEDCLQRYVRILDEETPPGASYPTRHRIRCDLCGGDRWEDIVWLAASVE